MMWPNLIYARRAAFPAVDKYFGIAVRPALDKEFAGVIPNKFPWEFRSDMAARDEIYVNNLASLKYREVEGRRVYEYGSYAHRPAGRFGQEQYHFRFFPHKRGTAVFAHYELSPLTRPQAHLDGEDWHADKGIQKARELLDIDPDADINEVTIPI